MPPDRQSEYERHEQMDEVVEAVAPIAEHARLDVAKRRKHASIQVIEQMAVEGPEARVVGIERDDHSPARWNQHGISHRPGEAPPVNLDDLKLVTVQVHRVRHPGLV